MRKPKLSPAVKHYFKTDMKKNSRIFIICTALHLLAFPLAFAVLAFDLNNLNDIYSETISDVFFPIAFVFTAIALLMGVFIAVSNFSYLHKKHENDMIMSLPLSNRQRFFTNYFSGILTYIIPPLIALVPTLITANIAKSFDIRGYYFPLDSEIDISVTRFIIQIYIAVIAAMLMFYTITVIACVLCGTLFETILHAVIINGAIPGMIALLSYISLNKAYGVDPVTSMLPLLEKTSPIGACIGFIIRADTAFMDEKVLFGVFFAKFILWMLLFTVVYAVAAYLLYRMRKSEDVAKPYVFKAYYHVIISCITFAICAIIPNSPGLLMLPMLVIAAVVFLGFDVLTKRGFRGFKFSVVRCVSTVVGSILLILVLNNTKGFGIGDRVPNPKLVKSASINYMGVVRYCGWEYDSLTFTDDEAIEIIVNAHKDFKELDNYEQYGIFEYDKKCSYDNYDTNYTITYTLNSGVTYSRTYPVSFEQLEALVELEATEEYPKRLAEKFKEIYSNSGGISFYTPIEEKGLYIGAPMSNTGGKYTEAINKLFVNDMAKAIKTDLSERTIEQIKNPSAVHGYFNIDNTYIFVSDTDVNMLEVLRKYGIYDEELGYFVDKCDWMLHDAIAKTDKSKLSTHMMYYDYSDLGGKYFNVCEKDERLVSAYKKLVANLRPYTFTDDEFYIMRSDINQIYNDTINWVVPEEFNTEALILYSYAYDDDFDASEAFEKYRNENPDDTSCYIEEIENENEDEGDDLTYYDDNIYE